MSKTICRSERIGGVTFVAMKESGTVGQRSMDSIVNFTEEDMRNLKSLTSKKIEEPDLKRKILR